MSEIKTIFKAVLPKGFSAGGVACGLKRSGKLDLALFVSAVPAAACGMFTTNKIKAAPVAVCRKYLSKRAPVRAIIANSGNANCFTGAAGLRDAYETSRLAARELGCLPREVLVASTGIIGKKLAMAQLSSGIPALAKALSSRGIDRAKQAIMTTDKFAKEISVVFAVDGKPVTVCGVAKGAGMIAPHMATMLSFVFTDARISSAVLAKVLSGSVAATYNCVTVDGCMSTNDTVIVMANGMSGTRSISGGPALKKFRQALDIVNLHLARMMVKDGEGATKCIEINVTSARTPQEARVAALAIANSNLFKTAVYGENPNFGRICAAVGASGIDIREQDLKIRFGSLKKKEVKFWVSLSRGKASATVYTSDLTPEYIKINAGYN